MRLPSSPPPYIPPPPLLRQTHSPALTHTLLPTQLRLAQIVEMIHVATLLHDDVIDQSPLRRGAASAPVAFGNKLAVLGGDFLLGRAIATLGRIGNIEVMELAASVIANLAAGENLQMKGKAPPPTSSSSSVDLKAIHTSSSHSSSYHLINGPSISKKLTSKQPHSWLRAHVLLLYSGDAEKVKYLRR
jgi:hexaprenyl-diphosphate synthase